MRKNFGAKPYTYPQPVFIIATYGEDGTPDAMNAAWGGISEANEISMCLSAGHKTVKNILARKAFTVSMADAAHNVQLVVPVDLYPLDQAVDDHLLCFHAYILAHEMMLAYSALTVRSRPFRSSVCLRVLTGTVRRSGGG